ncbi:NUDIX hydrolase [Nonlabens ulvanivorans]|uniref:NUDIX hydrolase n=1 Tax=Nonlabens ulvanivorans TaxID=906888 RepID=UPI002943BBCF|nr:CoA pyrophosphatase [Nonlabens ulvanivorans]WOI23236.1 CoA pyrophosphatase [Nonlabens ulvanivorans]
MISFNAFKDSVSKIKKMPLPGFEAQLKMAAVERLEELQHESLRKKTPRKAAVMMLVYPVKDIAHFVLIERMISKGAHSGQIAFPGGRKEEEDQDDAVTAIRETHEEVGIMPEHQEIITAGTPIYIPPSNYMVAPFLAFAKAELKFTRQPSEVKSIIEVPLHELMDPINVSQHTLSTSYATDITVPCYYLQNQVVWGATAMMLSEFKTMLQESLSLRHD